MLEIAIMIIVIFWFADTANKNDKSAILWGFIAALSFYGTVLIFGRLIFPLLVKGSVTYKNINNYNALGIVLNMIIGSCCLLFARWILMRSIKKDNIK
ncbi:MAG: hypothetical protein ACT6FE_07230 [Methanosarcinaceae archaeon]